MNEGDELVSRDGKVDTNTEVDRDVVLDGVETISSDKVVGDNMQEGNEIVDEKVGEIYLELVKDKIPCNFIMRVKDLIEASGGTCSGISRELKDILTKVEDRPRRCDTGKLDKMGSSNPHVTSAIIRMVCDTLDNMAKTVKLL